MRFIIELWKRLTQPSSFARWVQANTPPRTAYMVFYPDDPSKYVKVILTGVSIQRNIQ